MKTIKIYKVTTGTWPGWYWKIAWSTPDRDETLADSGTAYASPTAALRAAMHEWENC